MYSEVEVLKSANLDENSSSRRARHLEPYPREIYLGKPVRYSIKTRILEWFLWLPVILLVA